MLAWSVVRSISAGWLEWGKLGSANAGMRLKARGGTARAPAWAPQYCCSCKVWGA